MRPSEQTAWLLDHLRRGDTERYNGFIRALIYTGQDDIVTTLQESPSQFRASSSSVSQDQGKTKKSLVLEGNNIMRK